MREVSFSSQEAVYFLSSSTALAGGTLRQTQNGSVPRKLRGVLAQRLRGAVLRLTVLPPGGSLSSREVACFFINLTVEVSLLQNNHLSVTSRHGGWCFCCRHGWVSTDPLGKKSPQLASPRGSISSLDSAGVRAALGGVLPILWHIVEAPAAAPLMPSAGARAQSGLSAWDTPLFCDGADLALASAE